jgi:cell division protease FtsH
MTDNRLLRNGFVWIILIIAVIAVWFMITQGGNETSQTDLGEVAQAIDNGQVDRLVQREDSNEVTVHYRTDETPASFRLPPDVDIYQALEQYGVNASQVTIEIEKSSQWGAWIGALGIFLPFLLLIGIVVFMMRQAQGSNNQAMSFGKSRARMFTGNKPTVTFHDVAGVNEAKEELAEVVEFLKYPEKFSALGARIPRGVLLVGPPGTGKTLLSRAVAGEAGVPFFSISGSEFVEMFVGVGAARVRDLFGQAEAKAPCIVFIDELDALGKMRVQSPMGSHEEREQTLNQLLAEMDGFDARKAVIIMGATNRPEVLDPALLRPGRFDRQVLVDKPDINGREQVLKIHTRNVKMVAEIDLRVIAGRTAGFAGADLANLVNEAALLAARKDKTAVDMRDFDEAIDRLIAGLEKKRVMNPKEREIVAYHESGHAIVASSLAGLDPVHKISIVQRGFGALGYTMQLPFEDRYLMTRTDLLHQLSVLLAGRTAEEIALGEISTGAQNDLQRASDIARAMVTEFGMSDSVGAINYAPQKRSRFLDVGMPNDSGPYAEETSQLIDREVKRLVGESHAVARRILNERRATLEAVTRRLLEKEVMEGDELRAIMAETVEAAAGPELMTEN